MYNYSYVLTLSQACCTTIGFALLLLVQAVYDYYRHKQALKRNNYNINEARLDFDKNFEFRSQYVLFFITYFQQTNWQNFICLSLSLSLWHLNSLRSWEQSLTSSDYIDEATLKLFADKSGINKFLTTIKSFLIQNIFSFYDYLCFRPKKIYSKIHIRYFGWVVRIIKLP